MENLEEFVDVKGYEGLYKINKNGDVFGVKRNILLRPSKDKKGNYRIGLNKDGKKTTFIINRLIALNFIDINEGFKDINDYEGLYKINKNGDVFNVKNNRLLKPCKDKDGYYKIGLNKNNKKKMFRLHRLIALHFIPNPDNLPVIDHIDRNRSNNNIENLRWCTISDNNKNTEIKGSITKIIDKRNKKETVYYQIYSRCKYLKRCKNYEEAEEFLKNYLEENENN